MSEYWIQSFLCVHETEALFIDNVDTSKCRLSVVAGKAMIMETKDGDHYPDH